jgi:KaiC/GvpD/RAD55 family RecA-like ATPase
VEVRYSSQSVYIYHKYKLIATHPRLRRVGETSTLHEHMPSTSSMTSTTIPLGSIQAIRAHIRHLFTLFKFQKPTVIVTSEVTEESKNLSRDTVSEFLADGILFLSLDTTMDRRKVTIRKMRRTKHSLKPHDISITEQGITIHQ